MKKNIFSILTFLFITCSLFANDTYFYLAGGNLIPMEETENISVEMQEETIFINLQEDYYEVTVDFVFYNSGNDVELEVGFPFFSEGMGGDGKIWDCTCWTNGNETDYTKTNIIQGWYKPFGLEYANLRKISFPKNAITTTRVNFKTNYGEEAPSFLLATYLYGTGLSWKGPIKTLKLIIENNNLYRKIGWIKMASKSIRSSFQRIADNKYEFITYNVEPENYENVFEISLFDVLDNIGPTKFPSFFDFDKEVVDPENFKWYTKAQLRLVRNAIYALHGYEFKSNDLKEYFGKVGQRWNPPYTINKNFSEDDLSEIEKTNIKNLLEEESRR